MSPSVAMVKEKLPEDIRGDLRRCYNMGFPVLILGETGSGKTYSIKNFDTEEVGIFSVEKNRLPFKKRLKSPKMQLISR